MNRINQLFRNKQSGILSVYFPAGYPTLESTRPVLSALQAADVDMVEIGIPFSDPMADGVVIQQASGEALKNGMSLHCLFNQLSDVRREITLPILLMGYLNPIMRFGFESFCQRCAEVGVDGVIVPDLPFADYLSEYKPIADTYGVKMVMLITPETSDDRIELIDLHTDSFIYMVSSAATTGAQQSFDSSKQSYFERINRMNLKNPRLIGFGVSNRATFQLALSNASGAIVGSKFVQLLKDHSSPDEAVAALLQGLNE
ncbi:MAG: tryptophan synthase subunit alpha [Bacteroidales bacterium]